MRRLIVAIVGLFAVGACGGNTDQPRPDLDNACRPLVPLSDTPDPGSGPVACNALDGLELYLFDTFEAGQASIAWYTNNDRTALSDPLPDTDPIPSQPIPGGRCLGFEPSANAARVCETPGMARGSCETVLEPASRMAFHMRSGLLTSNGGQLGRTLSLDCSNGTTCGFAPGPPEVGSCSSGQGSTPSQAGCIGEDFSGWEGVVVWARVGPNSADTIKVRVADRNTDDKGCICNPYTDQNDSSTGCDKFSAFVPLDDDFRAYLVPFGEMLQGGWGMRAPKLDTGGLFSFAVEFGRGSWDLWIDDVGFYRRRE